MNSKTIKSNVHADCYRSMLRIRKIEQRLAEVYKEQIIRTPAHFGIGQEAVAVGACEPLMEGDVVYSHHRCHNHYLARGGDLYGLIAELLGREDGCSAGRGGSVHLTDRKAGFVISSAILGQTIAVAAGSALAFKMDGLSHVAVAFLGDATLEEGGFWETLNYAVVNKLPLLIVCENNGFSTESRPEMRQPEGTTLSSRVGAHNVKTLSVDGNDAMAVYDAASEAIEHCRTGNGPVFLECATYRWLEHVGPYFDYEMDRTYRTREELETWMERDPIKLSADTLLADGTIAQADMDSIEKEIDQEIEDALEKARNAPWPEAAAIFKNVY